MRFVLVLIALWNLFAVAVGLFGVLRRAARPRLARITNVQASAAVALSIAALVVGLFGAVIPVLGPAALFFGWSFWAAGGLVPFTVTLLLRAQRRGESESNETEA
jgi:hypothetical protein